MLFGVGFYHRTELKEGRREVISFIFIKGLFDIYTADGLFLVCFAGHKKQELASVDTGQPFTHPPAHDLPFQRFQAGMESLSPVLPTGVLWHYNQSVCFPFPQSHVQ